MNTCSSAKRGCSTTKEVALPSARRSPRRRSLPGHSRRHLFTVSGSYPEHHLIPVHPSAASILCEALDPDTAATDQEENQAPPLRCYAVARKGIQQIRSHEGRRSVAAAIPVLPAVAPPPCIIHCAAPSSLLISITAIVFALLSAVADKEERDAAVFFCSTSA
ncbi:hypothetical protein Droror1_Dr00008222 [Drosera rotundifolia]